MLHLPPQPQFWNQIQGKVSDFIWNGQRPRIKNSILQQDRHLGGLGVPNFESYYLSFITRALVRWFEQDSGVPWVELEKHIIHPYSFKDILFSGLSNTYCRRFGPLVAHSVYVWHKVVQMGQWDTKWHLDTPIFRNNNLLIAGKPIMFPKWQSQGVHSFLDIMDGTGLKTFSELRHSFNIPVTSFYFYLQLRASLNANKILSENIPQTHSLIKFLQLPRQEGVVSCLYKKLQQTKKVPMGIETVWNIDLKHYNQDINWKKVWNNIRFTSSNYNNQTVNYKLIHRYYLSP